MRACPRFDHAPSFSVEIHRSENTLSCIYRIAEAMALVLLCLVALTLLGAGAGEKERTDYCIIGAGPSGLQLGYFLKQAGRDYVIFEKNSTAGSFFLHYPRHRTLVSINKRNTGSTNKEFNFRHDWNSLISDNDSLQLTQYTKDYFPKADTYIQYLQDFTREYDLNIEYDTEVTQVRRESADTFDLQDQHNVSHYCRTVVVCTGLWKPNIPTYIKGIEHTVGYEEMSLDLDDYENKRVLILGRGNAGFETADHIVSRTALIHMAGRSRIKLAYQTHYVGDVRAINVQQIDTYQLKSLDGQFEGDLNPDAHAYIEKHSDGTLNIGRGLGGASSEDDAPNLLFTVPYDIMIRCLGFKFDFSLFHSSVPVRASPTAGRNKYPYILPTYRAVDVPDLYFAGVNTHSLDFRKSAGGFIHGFRYTTRALFRHLEWKYNGVPWPSVRLPYSSLLNHFLRRINEASGPYQMFSVLGDVALIRDDGMVDYLEEVPMMAMPNFKEMTGHNISRFILWEFEYGKNYSGPGKDVLSEDRVHGDPEEADLSNFLHPVLYYYSTPPKPKSMWKAADLPTPDLYHHIVEDFLTDWTSRSRHVVPLRLFLEAVFDEDLRRFLPETCFQLFFKHGADVPLSCKQEYLQGHGISLSDGYVDFGPLEALGNIL